MDQPPATDCSLDDEQPIDQADFADGQIVPDCDASDTDADTVNADSGLTVRQEIRKLQRLMLQVAETDEFGSARASAARAYRDLEVLRCAKRGKPLVLQAHMKIDTKPKLPPPTIAAIPDESAAA